MLRPFSRAFANIPTPKLCTQRMKSQAKDTSPKRKEYRNRGGERVYKFLAKWMKINPMGVDMGSGSVFLDVVVTTRAGEEAWGLIAFRLCFLQPKL